VSRLSTLKQALLLSLAVGVGSAIGCLLRTGLAIGLEAALGFSLLWSTLAANATGSLAIGWCAAWRPSHDSFWALAAVRLFLLAGVCGGYTTLSLFSVETVALVLSGATLAAAGHAALSLTVWLLAVWLGWRLGGSGSPIATV